MKFTERLKGSTEKMGVRVACALGVVTLAAIAIYGEVRAQGPEDLCKSDLKCVDEGQWGINVSNPGGIDLDESKSGIINVGINSSPSTQAAWEVLQTPSGAMQFSWNADQTEVLFGGQRISREVFFSLLDASAGYESGSNLETATLEGTQAIVATPTIQEATAEVDSTVREEIIVQEILGGLDALAQVLAVIGVGSAFLMGIGVIRHRRSEQKIRREAMSSVKKKAKMVGRNINEEILTILKGGKPKVEEKLDLAVVKDDEIIVVKRVAEQKQLLMPPSPEPVDILKIIRNRCLRRPLEGEKLGREFEFITINGHCMDGIFRNQQMYPLLPSRYIIPPRGQFGQIGDMVVIEYVPPNMPSMDYTTSAVGLYAGMFNGYPLLLSTNNTKNTEQYGHGCIATVPVDPGRDVKTHVLWSISKDSTEAQELVKKIIQTIVARGEYYKGDSRNANIRN